MTTQVPEGALAQFRSLAALHRLPVFRDVNSYQLLRLVHRAVPKSFKRGEPVVLPADEGGDEPFLLQVVDGEIGVAFADALGRDGQLMIRTNEVFGELSYITQRPIDARLTALRPAEVLFYRRRDFDHMFSCSASFRRSVKRGLETVAGQGDLASTYDVPKIFPDAPAELIYFQAGDDGVRWPLEALGFLLARALVDGFESRVLVLQIAGPEGEANGRIVTGDGLDVVRIRMHRVLPRLKKLAMAYEYIFVQPDADVPGDWQSFPEVVARLSRVRMWSAPPPAELADALTGPQVVETTLLDPTAARRSAPRFRRGKALTEGRGLAAGIPRLESRLELDLDDVAGAWARGGPAGLGGVYRAHRETLARWARTVSGRIVGLALGGGGAWGYAHVPLIRALHDKGVPIDVVSGASFGSVVGAYYAVAGLAGLEQLVARGGLLQTISRFSMVSTRLLEELIVRDLGDIPLEQTPILFHPFTTNLTEGRGAALTGGRLALAVRASSSAPGVFGPTILPRQGRFVDGCVVNNVPSVVLYARNAALRIAANIYPPPGSRPTEKGWIGSLVQQFNPAGRLLDATTSGSLMLHMDGVRQSHTASVVYDANQAYGTMPLMEASAFGDAEKIVAWAEKDARLHDAVEDAELIWMSMSSGLPS